MTNHTEHSNILFSKMFRVEFDEKEWIRLLDDWNARVDFTGYMKNKTLLGEWVSQSIPPPEVLTWLTEKNGTDIWNVRLQDEENPLKHMSAIEYVLRDLGDRRGNVDKALADLIPLLPLQPIIEYIERLQEIREPTNQQALKGKMAVVQYLYSKSAYESLDSFLRVYPDVMHDVQHNKNVASLVCVSGDGWDTYLKNGGSPFDRVHIDAHTNEHKDTALWQWLFQKKIYHPNMQKTLHDLLMRLHENKEPEAGDYVISDVDWKELVQNKSKILNEISMIEFEKNIDDDWKKALKSNKKWRAWRSNEGANFMLWLCAKQPSEFIRQAYKTKLNHPLLQEKDHLGRGFMHYLMTGVMTAQLGSYRKTEKLKTQWEEALPVIAPLMETSPHKGIFADWSESLNNSYFKALARSDRMNGQYEVSFLLSFMKNQPDWFWKGVNEQTFDRVFENEQVTARAQKLIQNFGNHFTEDVYKNLEESLTEKEKFKFFVMLSSYPFRTQQSTPMANFYRALAQSMDNIQTSEFNIHEAEQMNHWLKSQNKQYYYGNTEESNRIQAFLDLVVLKCSVAQVESKGSREAPKRKM